jgi:hypothetical protein
MMTAGKPPPPPTPLPPVVESIFRVIRAASEYTWAFLARPAPGLPTDLAGRAWAEILEPAKIFFGPSPARNAVFSYFTL